MSVTAIARNFDGNPNIVTMVVTDDLTTITTNGYLTTPSIMADIELLQNGDFQWAVTDIVLIYYSGGIAFFTHDATNNTFIANPPAGGVSSTLPSAEIIVGNASNVATAVAMTGDVHITNAGVTAIQTGAVTGAKIANNAVDYAQIALDVAATATVTLSSAQILALYDTPVQLIAAPGSGKLILIDSILWDIAFGTTQYAAGGAIQAQYGNTAHGLGSPASASIAAATLNGVAASGYIANGSGDATLNAPATVRNTAVFLSNATGDFTTGDSTATLYVRYRIVTPA
jgi:hypothetical protein